MAFAAASQNSEALKGNLLCFAAMVAWAAGFPAVEPLLDTWGVLALIAARMAVGAALLLCVLWLVEGAAPLQSANWRRGLVAGAFGFGLGATLLLLGQAMSDPVTTAIVAAMSPVAGAVYEFLFDKRRASARLIAGVALSIIGGLIAVGPALLTGDAGLGALVCLASVFVFVWGTRASNQQMPGDSALARTTVTSVGAAAFCGVAWIGAWSLGLGVAKAGAFGPTDIANFLVWTILAFVVSQTLWLWSAGALGVLIASLQMNAVPFYVMIAGVLALGAAWSWTQAAGAAIVGLGVIVAQAPLRFRRKMVP